MDTLIGVGTSRQLDARVGAAEAAQAAHRSLGGRECDLAFLFVCGSHLAAPEAALEAVHEVLEPHNLLGCGAGGVIGAGQEFEDETAVVVWAASFSSGSVSVFSLPGAAPGTAVAIELPDLADADGAIILADPATFPIDLVLHELSIHAPECTLAGGLTSAHMIDNHSALFIGNDVIEEGAVAVRFDGIKFFTESSGATVPIGPELTVTGANGYVIEQLAGQPALAGLRAAIEEVSDSDRQLAEHGLYLGLVLDRNKLDYGQGDFLVRGIVGADSDRGAISIGYPVEFGQVVRIHVRDPDYARRDLSKTLLRFASEHREPIAGALLFNCNNRGQSLFAQRSHDAEAIHSHLAGAPVGGFFAAGEIAPLSGSYFVHVFSATMAIFMG